jgi:hypothetical protein
LATHVVTHLSVHAVLVVDIANRSFHVGLITVRGARRATLRDGGDAP